MKNPSIAIIALGLVSCAAPKAVVIAEAPEKKPPTPVEGSMTPDPQEPMTAKPDDGLRIGDDILALPSDEQLRSSPKPSGDGDATLIARPPSE